MYPTREDLVDASSNEALLALDTDQQDALRTSAIQAVESWARQSFEAEGTEEDPVTRMLDGQGTDELWLPKRLALLDGIEMNGAVVADTDVQRTEGGASIKLVSPLMAGSWVNWVRRSPGDPGPMWYEGTGNIAVSGVWGWTDDEWEAGLLDSVATAIRYDMEDQAEADAHGLASTIRSARALGVESIDQGNLSLTLAPGESALSTRAQRQVLGLRWTVPYGSVA
jgi:hypothetical protein